MEFNNVEQFNFDGTETFKDLLDALAEITHAIYFINGDNQLAFYDLSGMFHPRLIIDNSMYIDLNTKENRRLTTVVHTTDLNDNINATSGLSGTTQYIRDNPFMALNTEYTVEVLEDAIEVFKDISLPQYDLEWRGNPTLEVLDALHIVTKDGNTLYGFLINDTTEYNGSLSQSTSWNYQDNEEETDSTPTSIGEAIKQTYAKIDKANKEISLVVESTDEKIKSANDDIDELKKEVSLKLNEEAVKIQISTAIDEIEGITTSTGFTFNERGLNISKSTTDISTTITENGMIVAQGSDEKLVANADGVKAEDLHATTYLIIGNNSRFEDYTNSSGEARTACFWIGG